MRWFGLECLDMQAEVRGGACLRQVGAGAVAVRFGDELPDKIEEKWREVYVDVTRMAREEMESEAGVAALANWLNKHQPISLCVNGSLELARRLWERSGVVVMTCGSVSLPALSCQARPQDAECFGELPPRAGAAQAQDVKPARRPLSVARCGVGWCWCPRAGIAMCRASWLEKRLSVSHT